MNKYAIWWDIIYYGDFYANTEWEAKLLAANGDADEAETLEACLLQ